MFILQIRRFHCCCGRRRDPTPYRIRAKAQQYGLLLLCQQNRKKISCIPYRIKGNTTAVNFTAVVSDFTAVVSTEICLIIIIIINFYPLFYSYTYAFTGVFTDSTRKNISYPLFYNGRVVAVSLLTALFIKTLV